MSANASAAPRFVSYAPHRLGMQPCNPAMPIQCLGMLCLLLLRPIPEPPSLGPVVRSTGRAVREANGGAEPPEGPDGPMPEFEGSDGGDPPTLTPRAKRLRTPRAAPFDERP